MALVLLDRLNVSVRTSSVDSFVFKLCYRWTVLLLVVFSAIITCRLFFGNSFACNANNGTSPQYMEINCYDETVYTLPARLIIRKDLADKLEPHVYEFRRYQSYYPWVNLLLLVHAFNFYLPHLLWKSYDGGSVRTLTAGVQNFCEEKRGLELCYLARYVIVSLGKHRVYTAMYILFEALNYCVALGQILWLTHFFGVTGVPEFLPLQLETWLDYRNFYFPKRGICQIPKLSTSGDTTPDVSLCETPLNSLYMLMFLFLRAWYILMTILCGSVLIYRIALLSPAFRAFVAKRSSPLAEHSVLKSLCHRLSYSDWFFLTHVQRTMSDVDFAQVLDKIVILSQGKDPLKDDDCKSSFFDEETRNINSSCTVTPL